MACTLIKSAWPVPHDNGDVYKRQDLSRYNARVSTEMNVLPILRFGINANMSYTAQDTANTSLFSAQGFRPDLPISVSYTHLDVYKRQETFGKRTQWSKKNLLHLHCYLR